MNVIPIHYKFTLNDQSVEEFNVHLKADDVTLIRENLTPADKLPEWTRLGFHQCQNCPYQNNEVTHCPLAVSIEEVVRKFERILSYDRLFLEVTIDKMKVSQETSAQRAISSLLGLFIATCGCPRTDFLKPMARFHMPLADSDLTIFRSTSMYLLAQYFLRKDGKIVDFDLEGLKRIYQHLDLVNDNIADRIRAASKNDSTVNAIVLLDLFAKTVPTVIEESLEDLKPLFSAYLK